jgi:hypothetical protein
MAPDGTSDVAAEEQLAAKIFGRWRDGTPIAIAGLYEEADPLLGGRTQSAEAFTEPKCPVRDRRTSILTHVQIKGGAYFFMPGLAALRYLTAAGRYAQWGRVSGGESAIKLAMA